MVPFFLILLWKACIEPILRGIQLFGFLDGTHVVQVAKITVGTGDAARQDTNPNHEAWVTDDVMS